MARDRIHLTGEQREFMALTVADRAGNQIEEFTGDMQRCDEPGKVVELRDAIEPYAQLIQALRSTNQAVSLELLRDCARWQHNRVHHSIQYEEKVLESLLAGEWDYGDDEDPAEIERSTRRIIAQDRSELAAIEAVLARLDEPLAVAA